MGKSNAEHQAAHRQRQKQTLEQLRTRIAELEAMGPYVRAEATQGPALRKNDEAMGDLLRKNAELKAMVEKSLRKAKELERENTQLKAEVARLESMDSHGPATEVIEPMGYVMPWEVT